MPARRPDATSSGAPAAGFPSDEHQAPHQYALANQASPTLGRPHLTHVPLFPSLPKGMLRSVACVSALICASHSALPHQPAMTNPGRPSMADLNSSYDETRVVCSSLNFTARAKSAD